MTGTPGTTDWVSAVAILASGLILGLMFMYFVGRRRAAAAAAPAGDADLELRDLEAKRDALVRQIRELEDVGSKLDPHQAAEERTRLELETAQVLRSIDQHRKKRGRQAPSPVSSPTPAQPPVVRSGMAIGFAWGASSMLAVVLLAYFVMNAAKPRGEGDGLTGGGPMQGAGQGQAQAQAAPAQADPTVQRLEATVQQSPDNLEARVELARMYLEKDNLMGVFDQTQYVLEKTPNDARALTYQGLVRLAMGQGSEAVGMLEKATKIDPKLIDGWVALAWVHTQEGKIAEAEKAMGEAIRQHPEEKVRLEEVLAQMKSSGGRNMQQAATTPVGGSSELPPGHPPVTPASPRVGPVSTAAAPSSDAKAIRITLDAPASASGGGTLFVFARAAGVTAGPPIAVKRMNVTTFPITFELGQADSMMGQQLPAKVRVEARLDADGNAMTKTPGEPSAMLDAVSTGSAIKLALK